MLFFDTKKYLKFQFTVRKSLIQRQEQLRLLLLAYDVASYNVLVYTSKLNLQFR